MRRYVLEAQRYTASYPMFVHIGYVKFIFSSKEEAGEFYYDQYPGHRSINRDGDWISGWSDIDGLRYLVLPYANQDLELKGDRSDISVASLERMNADILLKKYRPYEYRPPIMSWKGPEF